MIIIEYSTEETTEVGYISVQWKVWQWLTNFLDIVHITVQSCSGLDLKKRWFRRLVVQKIQVNVSRLWIIMFLSVLSYCVSGIFESTKRDLSIRDFRAAETHAKRRSQWLCLRVTLHGERVSDGLCSFSFRRGLKSWNSVTRLMKVVDEHILVFFFISCEPLDVVIIFHTFMKNIFCVRNKEWLY